MARIALQVRDLSVQFGGVTALHRVNFRMKEGELRCLIGPNGAGKSTFFKCLTGVLSPSEGYIMLRGEDSTSLRPHQITRLGIGIKTQVPSVMNELSVRENIWIAARRKHNVRVANGITGDMLNRFNIVDLASRTLSVLAHGKRQLVEFAMVLAQQPWLVLLDEPAAGMSGDEVAMIAQIIREINRTATVIVVEHDMNFVRMIAEQITVLHQGRILRDDHVDTVLSDPVVRDVYLGKST